MNRIDDPSISFREYFSLMVEKETGVILERLRGMDIEHKKDAAELARRLEELNHAHSQAQGDRNRFVDRQVYDPWRDLVNQSLTEMRSNWKYVAGLASLISSLIVGSILLLARGLLR